MPSESGIGSQDPGIQPRLLTPDSGIHSVCRLPLQELAAPDRSHKFAIPGLYLTSNRDHRSPSALLPPLVRVVIDVRVAAFLRKRAPVARVVDDEIGVAAELDRAFLGV